MQKKKIIPKVALILLFACLFTMLPGCTTPTNSTDPTENNGLSEFVAKPLAFYGWEGADSSVMKDMNVVISDDCIVLSETHYSVSQLNDFDVEHYSFDEFYYYYDEAETRAIIERIIVTEEFSYLKTGNSSLDIHEVVLMYDIDGTYYFCYLTPSGDFGLIRKIWFAEHS